ncbi:MAG: hypothetical protein H6767_08945 [Candidatus Peribacteria bacterium]|nr:MAG: hypothetical protein H6767_08945 [Candidatus Peribacteria bacterium]
MNNKITLEEAIAVILRNSGIFSIADNQAVMNDILAGRITENIAEDVAPKNLDGSPYTFYGYLREALTYTLREVTPSGEEKVYQLLELKDGKIRPKKQVTKEEFLRIAYIALKANSCIEVSKNSLSLDFHIFDASCSEGSNCSESPLTSDQKIYDF